MPEDIIEIRRQFENDLREEVEAARDIYQDLSRQCVIATREMVDAPGTDGTLAAAQAGRLQRACSRALSRYDAALKKFSRVIVHREYPAYLDNPKD